jgi:hypothetical protein
VTESIEVELPAGDCEVEQTMLADGAGSETTRRFTMQLAAGQSYRWRLMTLLSDDAADGLESGKIKASHE